MSLHQKVEQSANKFFYYLEGRFFSKNIETDHRFILNGSILNQTQITEKIGICKKV